MYKIRSFLRFFFLFFFFFFGKLARNRETARTRMGSRKCRVSIDISTLKNVCKQQSMTNQFVVAVLLSRIVHCVLVCYNV